MSDKESLREKRARLKKETPQAQPGSVFVEKGGTFNLGNYNSYKMSIGMTLPVNYTEADLKNARKALKKSAELVQEELDEILSNDGIEGLDGD